MVTLKRADLLISGLNYSLCCVLDCGVEPDTAFGNQTTNIYPPGVEKAVSIHTVPSYVSGLVPAFYWSSVVNNVDSTDPSNTEGLGNSD
jgi:hypothetical protein